jgi:hypothetical protein
MKNDNANKLDHVRDLYAHYASIARDRAALLLGDDPFQADRVTRKVLRAIAETIDLDDSEKRVTKWIEEKVVRLCLLQTGNRKVADWEAYQLDHPEPKRKRSAAAAAPADNVRVLRPAKAAPTRKARQERLEARTPGAAAESVRQDGPEDRPPP